MNLTYNNYSNTNHLIFNLWVSTQFAMKLSEMWLAI